MAYNLIYTDAFEKDLDSILNYIINKLYNPKAALRLYKNIKSTFAKIIELPEMYPLHPLKQLSEKGFHFFQVGNYLIFYTIDHEHKIIYARYGLRSNGLNEDVRFTISNILLYSEQFKS